MNSEQIMLKRCMFPGGWELERRRTCVCRELKKKAKEYRSSSWSCEKAGWLDMVGYGWREGGAQGDGTVVCPVDLRPPPPAMVRDRSPSSTGRLA